MSVVVDASAVLAFLLNEPGADRVAPRLNGALIASVNVSELVGFYAKRGAEVGAVRARLTSLSMVIVSVDADMAFDAGMLQPVAAKFGLSLGDRMCLALARQRGVPALTADRAWKAFGEIAGIEIDLIR